MNKSLLSLAELSRKEIEDLINFAEKFINTDETASYQKFLNILLMLFQ